VKNKPGSDRRDLDHPPGSDRRDPDEPPIDRAGNDHIAWETDRYRMVTVSEPRSPSLLDHERIVSIAAHPRGVIYLIEKGPAP